jgi:hypothetical protein
MGPWASEAIAPHLPTTSGLEALYARMYPEREEVVRSRRFRELVYREYLARANTTAGSPASVALNPDGSVVLDTASADPSPESFRRVGHCLWALLVACVGGVIGRALHARGERTGSVPALGPGVDPRP